MTLDNGNGRAARCVARLARRTERNPALIAAAVMMVVCAVLALTVSSTDRAITQIEAGAGLEATPIVASTVVEVGRSRELDDGSSARIGPVRLLGGTGSTSVSSGPGSPWADAATPADTSQPTTAAPPTTTGAAETTASTGRPTTASTATTAPTSQTTAASPTTGAPGDGETGIGGACFSRIFRDDFDGTALGPSWRVYTANGRHSPHAVRRAEAISVGDGHLVITAANDEAGTLVSGGLRHDRSQRYGKFSFRVRTDPDTANATSGVVLTWPASNDQPRDGENNIYETLRTPGDRSQFYSFIHEPFDDRADGVSQKRFVHQADATQWQEVTMEWTPTYLLVSRTGPGRQASETQRIDESGEDRISDASHFLSIQLDQFKGSFPDDRHVRMQVDWIEVHEYCGG